MLGKLDPMAPPGVLYGWLADVDYVAERKLSAHRGPRKAVRQKELLARPELCAPKFVREESRLDFGWAADRNGMDVLWVDAVRGEQEVIFRMITGGNGSFYVLHPEDHARSRDMAGVMCELHGIENPPERNLKDARPFVTLERKAEFHRIAESRGVTITWIASVAENWEKNEEENEEKSDG